MAYILQAEQDFAKDSIKNKLYNVRKSKHYSESVAGLTGIGGFARGGDFNRKHANRIMRYRIIAQACAVALILLFVLVSGGLRH